MIYITGDCHADFSKFTTRNFPEQNNMSKEDYVIICGDFGIWDDSARERYWPDWLNQKKFTTLFVDGNHENFDRLSREFDTADVYGGKAHRIRDSIYHLMRGYIFNIGDKKIFAFGGAQSHDIRDGILEPKDYKDIHSMVSDYNKRTRNGELLRINHISWWKEEIPTENEMKQGITNLSKNDFVVDYVITHCPPQDVCQWFGYYDVDDIINYFNHIKQRVTFTSWWSGHLHKNEYNIFGKYNVVYNDIIRIE